MGLSEMREEFEALGNGIVFSKDAQRGAAFCAQAEGKGTHKDMIAFLTELAQKGWAHFSDEDDPRVLLASLRDVGGVIVADTFAPGIPRQWRKEAPDAKQIFVATNQAMRLLVASELRAVGKLPQRKQLQ